MCCRRLGAAAASILSQNLERQAFFHLKFLIRQSTNINAVEVFKLKYFNLQYSIYDHQ